MYKRQGEADVLLAVAAGGLQDDVHVDICLLYTSPSFSQKRPFPPRFGSHIRGAGRARARPERFYVPIRIGRLHQKEPGPKGPALWVADFTKKLLLHAALLAALAHALETNGAIDQSKQLSLIHIYKPDAPPEYGHHHKNGGRLPECYRSQSGLLPHRHQDL